MDELGFSVAFFFSLRVQEGQNRQSLIMHTYPHTHTNNVPSSGRLLSLSLEVYASRKTPESTTVTIASNRTMSMRGMAVYVKECVCCMCWGGDESLWVLAGKFVDRIGPIRVGSQARLVPRHTNLYTYHNLQLLESCSAGPSAPRCLSFQ